MGLFNRYVCAEVLKVLFVALSALTSILLLILVGKEARDQGLNPLQVLQLVPYLLPLAMQFTVPGTVLLAVCTVYGRMSGANEIVALKSLGISPLTVIWPVLLIAAGLSVVTIWLNDMAVSWGRAGVQRAVVESCEEILYSMLRSQKRYSNGTFSIIVKDVQQRELIQPTITFLASGSTPTVTITAETARIRADLAEMVLSMECFNGTVDIEGEGRLRFHDSIERKIPLTLATGSGEGAISPSHMALDQLPREISIQRQRIGEFTQELGARAALEILTGDLPALASTEWDTRYRGLQEERNRLYRLQTEGPRRQSTGFSCLCFALIGIPIAVRFRNSDMMTTFGRCFVPILVLYYPLMMFGINQAKSGAMPPSIVWLGNGIIALIGVWQLRHVWRY